MSHFELKWLFRDVVQCGFVNWMVMWLRVARVGKGGDSVAQRRGNVAQRTVGVAQWRGSKALRKSV